MPSGHLQIIIDPELHGLSYEQGDIVSAQSHLGVRRSAGERICFERLGTRQFANLNGSGFLSHSHLLKDWHDACCEFRLERLNRNEAKQIRLRDMAEIEITTGVPHTDLRGNENRFMDVNLYFSRQIATFKKQTNSQGIAKNAQGRAIFSDDGDTNKVVIYGGSTTIKSSNMDTIWTAITNKTGRLEADETTYEKEPPFGAYMRRRLILRVDDFDEVTKGELTEPLEDKIDPDNPVQVKKRKSFVDWEGSLALSAETKEAIRDDSQDPDLRVAELSRSTIVITKSI